MKFTFNFDIAVLITLLTSFLFWCGYWYNYGYVEYFGVTISFSDLSFPYTLIDGLLVGIDKFISLFLFLLVTAFLAGNSGKNGVFIFNTLVSLLIGLIIFIRYFCYDKYKNHKYYYIVSYYQSPLLKKYFPKPVHKKPDFSKSKSFTFAKNYLVEKKIDFSTIKKSIYGKAEIDTGIVQNVLFYFSALLLFIFILLILLISGMSLQHEGQNEAKKNFELNFEKRKAEDKELFSVFPKIKEIKSNEAKSSEISSQYLLTNICNKDSCFAVNTDKITKLVKLENIEILNGKDKPSN